MVSLQLVSQVTIYKAEYELFGMCHPCSHEFKHVLQLSFTRENCIKGIWLWGNSECVGKVLSDTHQVGKIYFSLVGKLLFGTVSILLLSQHCS